MSDIREYDVIVIGSGSGATIVSEALEEGLSVALVERGPLGGTCLNVGCIPTKMIIFPADRIVEIREAKKLGITAEITKVDFGAIMKRMRRSIGRDRNNMRRGINQTKGLDFYEVEAHFVAPYTLQVGDSQIRGHRIFCVNGARPLIPPIPGLDQVDYLTNESLLQLEELPESLIILGGGYIGAEFAHLMEAMGARVTLVEMLDRLVPAEEPEISAVLEMRLRERMDVRTRTRVDQVSKVEGGCLVTARDLHRNEVVTFQAERLLVAAGRRSNADLLQVQNAGIETDERGYIRANAYLETSVERIWAFGDVIGKAMFRHSANREALIAWHNATSDHKVRMDYMSVPHAVFSYPQIGSVGMTEAQARKEFKVIVGLVEYHETAQGEAMMEQEGFAKVIVDRENKHILGLHVVGPYAPILVQEGITTMANAGTIDWIAHAIHIHPSISEVVGDLPFVLHAHD